MNPSATAPSSHPRTTPDEWDKIRHDFHASLMLTTTLAALAENIDGCVWPIKTSDETPAAYIDLPHLQALARLEKHGLAPYALDKLVEILRGTLAFDESFGEMVDVAGKAEAYQDPVARNLERLGIPVDFPVRLCNFKPVTHEFCQRENIEVLADFLAFSRGASRQVIIGGEFRELLNAITHVDEQTIGRFLPFRRKSTGLHFLECLALILRELPEEKREPLILAPQTLPPALRERGERYATHFSDQVGQMRAAFATGTPISRLVAPLDDLLMEPVVASVLRIYLAPPQAPKPAAKPVKRSFFARVFGFGK